MTRKLQKTLRLSINVIFICNLRYRCRIVKSAFTAEYHAPSATLIEQRCTYELARVAVIWGSKHSDSADRCNPPPPVPCTGTRPIPRSYVVRL